MRSLQKEYKLKIARQTIWCMESFSRCGGLVLPLLDCWLEQPKQNTFWCVYYSSPSSNVRVVDLWEKSEGVCAQQQLTLLQQRCASTSNPRALSAKQNTHVHIAYFIPNWICIFNPRSRLTWERWKLRYKVPAGSSVLQVVVYRRRLWLALTHGFPHSWTSAHLRSECMPV